MRKYILTRLIQLIPVLFGLTIIVYGLMYLAPGDPAAKRLQERGALRRVEREGERRGGGHR